MALWRTIEQSLWIVGQRARRITQHILSRKALSFIIRHRLLTTNKAVKHMLRSPTRSPCGLHRGAAYSNSWPSPSPSYFFNF